VAVERERRRRERTTNPRLALRLVDFIPTVSPELASPHHLAPMLELFERIKRGESIRAVVSTPPQHGKSVSAFHALIWLMLSQPNKRHAYGTYAQQFARDQSYRARRIAEHAGLALSQESADRWATDKGGGVVWTGVGGPLTGHPVDGVLLLDDLIKNRQDAESALIRERTFDWLTSVALTRVHPGASVIAIATRWHSSDPNGRLLEHGWEPVVLPAINDAGEALWPEQRPLDWLEQQRAQIGEYDFASLYMCNPRPKGGAVFADAHYYDALPEGGYREAWGADWAYTASSRADYSVAIKGRLYGDTLYLTDMVRQQSEVPAFVSALRARGVTHVTSYMSGTEKAITQFLRGAGVTVKPLSTTADKFTRAQPVAAAWNAGKVLLPRARWVDELLPELLAFTGVSDAHDDTVDALAGLHAELALRPVINDDTPPSLSFKGSRHSGRRL
jgi:predicted phage terminase large subunit-like protein